MNFISVTHPGQRASAKTTRKAHAHAARVAHARARRQRMADFKAQQRPNSVGSVSENNDINDQTQNLISLASQPKTPASIPYTLPGDFQPDAITHFLQLLSPAEQFVFNHYVQVVLPVQVAYCPVLLDIKEKASNIRNNWIFFAATDPVILRGCLLAACRHLSRVELRHEYNYLAIKYKQHYLQTVRNDLSSNSLSSRRSAVAMTTVLALDEIICGDHPVAAKHVLGAMKIIEDSGGLDALGLNHLVRYILYSLMFGKRLSEWDINLQLTSILLTPDSILP